MTDTRDATAVDLAEVFGELAIDLEDAAGVEPTVGTVLEFAVAAFKCTDAGIVLVGPGGRKNLRVAEVTNPVVAELNQLQIDAGSGPLIEAAEGSEPVLVDDTRAESRWPGWAERAAGRGIGTVLHHPMLTKTRTIGVLSFYSADPGAFTAYDEALAQILCQHATVAVAYARNEETLAEALEARAVVGQAIGILMERHNLTERGAFSVLRRYSQDYNVKLRSIADQLISSRSLPPPAK
ncbi:GAF and ANTAR domain-containing protein [Kribbella sp. VKM Ac-2568]|uniref:GAF and ANTAR domain-containing protein n=1 Tax=Kribbella sp. VKM Ac-2568 TaxID=2512219 RepID=UPI001049D301|nr:GAF and ANTAR domain-containing protein [Kribbella sp. VKM Ac-2568]TCM46824.1 GAF domain-containing protein [Kribbella sp. VKM Ac-2568]